MLQATWGWVERADSLMMMGHDLLPGADDERARFPASSPLRSVRTAYNVNCNRR